MVSQYVGNRHQNWDQHIEAVQFALNTATHAATGYSPAFLVHGRELARPHPEDRRQPEELRPEDRHQALLDAYEVARVHLARAYQAQEHHYNLRRREWRPKIGEKSRGGGPKRCPRKVASPHTRPGSQARPTGGSRRDGGGNRHRQRGERRPRRRRNTGRRIRGPSPWKR
ncbi:uncharacterized protein LOC118645244 [Monomorium pharaonis]|uniref:uncharacterized protein LOC118645244 n=1 Tax=Monomorium pharaonis TaxID=307658 RepID=UPI001747BF44|nr:uncharacterized protein LOC118645244 [Monomorium pharaonis]